MKATFYAFLIVLSFGFGLRDINNRDLERSDTEIFFNNGEELIYSLRYGPIHGGVATLSLNLTDYNNNEVFHARVHARTVGLTDKLFDVEDIYESYFDIKSGLPYKAIRDISEDGYKFYNEVYFAHDKGLLTSQKSGEYEVPSDILDVVSSLYYLRKMNLDTLKNGDVIPIITFFGDEIFPFPLRYRGIEKVKTKLGKFKCHRFDPVVEAGRVFKTEDDMIMWLSADENMVPIRIKLDMIVGSVKCDLVKHKNLPSELRSI